MKLWDVTTMAGQVFKIAAFTSTEALEVYFGTFPNEKEIKSLNDVGIVYSTASLEAWQQELMK